MLSWVLYSTFEQEHLQRTEKVQQWILSSGCDSVGRVFASDTRDPDFESSHRQILLTNCIKSLFKRRKLTERGREWPMLKSTVAWAQLEDTKDPHFEFKSLTIFI